MTDELVMVVPRQALFGRNPVFQGFSPNAEGYFRRCLEEHLFMPRRRAESDERYKQIIPYVVLQTCPGPGQRYQYLIFQRTSGGDARLGRLYSVGLGGHVNSTDVLVPPVVRAPGALRSEPSSRLATGERPAVASARRTVAAAMPVGGRAARSSAGRWNVTGVAPAAAARAGGRPGQNRRDEMASAVDDAGHRTRRVIRKLKFAAPLRALVDPIAGPRAHEHPLFHGIRRELREEVVFPPGAQLSLLGVINDDSNSVGRVHFGLAFLLEVPPTVEVRRKRRYGGPAPAGRRSAIRLRKEPGTAQVGDLLPLDHVLAYRHAMETWSSLLLDAGVLASAPLPGKAAI